MPEFEISANDRAVSKIYIGIGPLGTYNVMKETENEQVIHRNEKV